MKSVTVTMTEERYKELEVQAEQSGLKKSTYIRTVLFEKLDNHPKSQLKALRTTENRLKKTKSWQDVII